jgi:hypothetical protein
LAHPLERHRGVLGFGRPQLRGGDQQVGVDALQLIGHQLSQPQVDAPNLVVELVNQEITRHPIGVGELTVDGHRPRPQPNPV